MSSVASDRKSETTMRTVPYVKAWYTAGISVVAAAASPPIPKL
eukprot:CAMPEP_0198151308 /NCGR_PEP_ID=MMETSP1443-20131203/55150_1 /TAXON_ID=186043 /ORGANISM="Entomoneis sp., Strain CCMP2396" /LENGTH=42 /DNA_ID= /DNA_START= /DNA_END= /DNA_ORIENTATION=